MGYDGFVSYSHAADGLLAPRLQHALARFAKPWWRRRALSIFRDETGLSANPHLWSSIVSALDESRFFILLASPESAASDWVGREIDHWVRNKGAEQILVAVTDGEWMWDTVAGDIDLTQSTAAHSALRGVFAAEPRHVDLTWARTEQQVDHRDGRFRVAVADLAAPMHGKPKDELVGDDVREHRRTLRTAWSAATVLALLTVTALLAGILAIRQRDEAQQQRARADVAAADAETQRAKAEDQARQAIDTARRATAAQLASDSTVAARDGDADLAALLAIEAFGDDDTPHTRGVLLNALTARPRLVRQFVGGQANLLRRLRFGAGLAVTEKSIAITDGGVVDLIDRKSGDVNTINVNADEQIVDISLTDSGLTVLAVTTTGADPLSIQFQLKLHRFSATGASIGDPVDVGSSFTAVISRDGSTIATIDVSSPGALTEVARVIRTSDMAVLATVNFPDHQGGYGIALSHDGRLLALTGEREASVWRVADSTSIGSIQLDEPQPQSDPFGDYLTFSPDDSVLAFGGRWGPRVELWDVPGQASLASIPLQDDTTPGPMAFDDDAKHLAVGLRSRSGGRDPGTEVIDLRSMAQQHPLLAPLAESITAVGPVAFSPGSEILISGKSEWDLSNTLARGAVPFAAEQSDGTWTPNADYFIPTFGLYPLNWSESDTISSLGPVLRAFDTATGTIKGTADPFQELFTIAATSLELVGVRPDDALLRTFDLTTGAASDRGPYDWATQDLADLELSDDGHRIATLSNTGRVVVADIDGGTVLYDEQVVNSGDGQGAIALDRNGARIAVFESPADANCDATLDGFVTVIEVASGAKTRVAGAKCGEVHLSPDGSRVIFTSEPHNAGFEVADATTGKPLAHIEGAWSSRLSSDDRYVLINKTASIGLFDLATGQEIEASLPAVAAAFSPDGRQFAVGSFGGVGSNAYVVRAYPIEPNDQIARLCSIVGRNLTATEWQRHLPDETYRATCPDWPSSNTTLPG